MTVVRILMTMVVLISVSTSTSMSTSVSASASTYTSSPSSVPEQIVNHRIPSIFERIVMMVIFRSIFVLAILPI